MQKEAEEHADEDKRKKELVEAKNQAETLIYTAEKTLHDLGDKADSNLKEDVLAKIKTLNEVKESENSEEIKTQTETLSQSLQALGSKMYEQTSQTEQPVENDNPKTEEKEEPKEG
jgi:molecular chaperone DnaK